MKPKSLIVAVVLTVLMIPIAIAKSYDVVFASPTKAGSLQLKPGQYRISLSGNKLTFTDVKTDKSVSTDVKIENTDTKFNMTMVETSTEAGGEVVKDIELGGSKIKLEF